MGHRNCETVRRASSTTLRHASHPAQINGLAALTIQHRLNPTDSGTSHKDPDRPMALPFGAKRVGRNRLRVGQGNRNRDSARADHDCSRCHQGLPIPPKTGHCGPSSSDAAHLKAVGPSSAVRGITILQISAGAGTPLRWGQRFVSNGRGRPAIMGGFGAARTVHRSATGASAWVDAAAEVNRSKRAETDRPFDERI